MGGAIERVQLVSLSGEVLSSHNFTKWFCIPPFPTAMLIHRQTHRNSYVSTNATWLGCQNHSWVTSSPFCNDIASSQLLRLGANQSCIYTGTKWDLHAMPNNYTLLSCQVHHIAVLECVCMCPHVTFPRQLANAQRLSRDSSLDFASWNSWENGRNWTELLLSGES